MNERHRLILALICGVATATAIVLTKRHQPTLSNSPQSAAPVVTSNELSRNSSVSAVWPSQSRAVALPDLARSQPQLVTPIKPTAIAADVSSKPKPRNKSKVSGGSRQPPLLAAPQARIALALVGTDPDAENVWASAIDDPFIPANERKDLIEDLNEDGFADPHHIAPEEMPLVLSRMQLIEQLAPYAMDDTNAAAFEEAYKDLTNMLTDPNPK